MLLSFLRKQLKWRANGVLFRASPISAGPGRARPLRCQSFPRRISQAQGEGDYQWECAAQAPLLSSLLSHCWHVWLPLGSIPSLSYKYFILSVPTASNNFFKRHFLFLFFFFFPLTRFLRFKTHTPCVQHSDVLSASPPPKCNCFKTADSWRKQFSLHYGRLQLLSSFTQVALPQSCVLSAAVRCSSPRLAVPLLSGIMLLLFQGCGKRLKRARSEGSLYGG